MSAHNLSAWPYLFREFAAIIGPDKTLALAHAHGGMDRVYIPRKVSGTHPWVETIGLEACQQLARAFGGQRVNLPRGAHVHLKKLKVFELAERGLSKREIARQVRCTERYVRLVLWTPKEEMRNSL